MEPGEAFDVVANVAAVGEGIADVDVVELGEGKLEVRDSFVPAAEVFGLVPFVKGKEAV